MEKKCNKHQWHIVSYFKVIDVVVVRRECANCGKRQDADVSANHIKIKWYMSPNYQLS